MYLGVDIGSVSINVALINEARALLAHRIERSGCNHGDTVERVVGDLCASVGISAAGIHTVVATGYGRRNVPDAQFAFTEITCHAVGVHHLFPQADRVIDIGGQDSKAISLTSAGGVENFTMNDKCAAGTGRFLEVMAGVLQMDLETFSRCGIEAKSPYRISSTCTVFAESEVISGIAKGVPAESLAAGLYEAVAGRVAALAATLGNGGRYVLTGGVAKSEGISRRLKKRFPSLEVPFEPQITGALGAALMGWYKQHE